MTKKQYLEAVANGVINDEVKEYAKAELEKYKNSKEYEASERRAAMQSEVVEYLRENGKTSVTALAAAIGLDSHLPMCGACKPLVDGGVIVRSKEQAGDKLLTYYALAEEK